MKLCIVYFILFANSWLVVDAINLDKELKDLEGIYVYKGDVDQFGFEGYFWRKNIDRHEFSSKDIEPVCDHYVQVTGYCNPLKKDIVVKGDTEYALICSEPIIYRDLLSESRKATITQIEMACGIIFYLVAYFDKSINESRNIKKVNSWNNYIHSSPTLEYLDSNVSLTMKNDEPSDTDLLPWIKKGKLFWCEPGSGNKKLSDKKPEECPFLDLDSGINYPHPSWHGPSAEVFNEETQSYQFMTIEEYHKLKGNEFK